MTHEEMIDIVAEKIRDAWSDHRIERYNDYSVTARPWSSLPDERKVKWRKMAQAAFEVIRS